jgi:hypothetical protein
VLAIHHPNTTAHRHKCQCKKSKKANTRQKLFQPSGAPFAAARSASKPPQLLHRASHTPQQCSPWKNCAWRRRRRLALRASSAEPVFFPGLKWENTTKIDVKCAPWGRRDCAGEHDATERMLGKGVGNTPGKSAALGDTQRTRQRALSRRVRGTLPSLGLSNYFRSNYLQQTRH